MVLVKSTMVLAKSTMVLVKSTMGSKVMNVKTWFLYKAYTHLYFIVQGEFAKPITINNSFVSALHRFMSV